MSILWANNLDFEQWCLRTHYLHGGENGSFFLAFFKDNKEYKKRPWQQPGQENRGKEMTENFNPEITVLYCRQSVEQTTDVTQVPGLVDGARARLVAMPCSSKVEVPHLMRILEDGADGVLVIACPDKQCRFLVGNTRAEKRVAHAAGLLEEIGMGAARVAIVRGENLKEDDLARLCRQQADAVAPLGMNPLRKI